MEHSLCTVHIRASEHTHVHREPGNGTYTIGSNFIKVIQLKWLNHPIAHVVAKFVLRWLHSFALFRSHSFSLFVFIFRFSICIIKSRDSMNTCCFLASILICNIENGITQKWTCFTIDMSVCLFVYWLMRIETARGTAGFISSITNRSRHFMEMILLYMLEIAFNTWSLKHSFTHLHTAYPFALWCSHARCDLFVIWGIPCQLFIRANSLICVI